MATISSSYYLAMALVLAVGAQRVASGAITIGQLTECLAFMTILQLPVRQIWTMAVPSGLDWQRGWEEFVETVRRVVAVVEEAGLRYAMEPHPYRYVANAAGMLRLLDHVPSPALGINYDPSHTFPAGDMPHLAVYQLAGRVFHCHVSDNDALTNAHWRPGQGKIDWRAVMAALRDVGFDGTISVELEDVPGVATPGRESTPALDTEYRESQEYLRAIGEELGIAWA